MRVYRVTKTKWAGDLDGTGSARSGGRWNSPGVPVCYTALDADTALEELLGSGVPRSVLRQLYCLVEIEVEGRSDIRMPRLASMPEDWDQVPFGVATQRFGDALLREGALAIRVPSTRRKEGVNYVLNPRHPEFQERVKVVSVRIMADVLGE